MSNFIRILFVSLFIGGGSWGAQAQTLPPPDNDVHQGYDEIGVIDSFMADKVVVSDSVYTLSSFVSCFDVRGNKDIACYGTKKAKWVGLIFDDGIKDQGIQLKSIHQLSESQYKALVKDEE